VVSLLPGDAGVLLPLVAPVQLVLANIISTVLIELLPGIHEALVPGGHAVLAGLLLTEREMMLDRFGDDWRVVAEDHEGDWWAVTVTPPQLSSCVSERSERASGSTFRADDSRS
jgi:ribosomal protein L11 methyltransferase